MNPDHSLQTEGDVNFSANRQNWYATLDDDTLQSLEEDSGAFLHQALSSPCLNTLVAADGIYITDVRGKRYMDFHGNNVHQVGYRNPVVIERVKSAMDTLPFSPRRYTNPWAIAAAQRLTSLLPAELSKVLFCPGGTSAIGIALKLARTVTGKQGVISFEDSFHGASLDAIDVGGEEQFKRHLGKFSESVIRLPQPCRDSRDETHDIHLLEQAIISNPGVGAFIAETVRNTDVRIPGRHYWQQAQELCTRHGVVLILDEIPIAFGRTGKMFAFEHYDIAPDILCLGKGLGGAVMPIAAMVCQEKFNVASDISLGHYTHEKSPMGCAAVLGMLDYIESSQLLSKATANGQYLQEKLFRALRDQPAFKSLRRIGMLLGIELQDTGGMSASEISERTMYACLVRGLSFKVSAGRTLQWCPPLMIDRQQLDEAVGILLEALTEVTSLERQS